LWPPVDVDLSPLHCLTRQHVRIVSIPPRDFWEIPPPDGSHNSQQTKNGRGSQLRQNGRQGGSACPAAAAHCGGDKTACTETRWAACLHLQQRSRVLVCSAAQQRCGVWAGAWCMPASQQGWGVCRSVARAWFWCSARQQHPGSMWRECWRAGPLPALSGMTPQRAGGTLAPHTTTHKGGIQAASADAAQGQWQRDGSGSAMAVAAQWQWQRSGSSSAAAVAVQ
jgi:hypothetical protein